jgi:hypothetical protein
MLRDPLTLENARAWASFVAISGQLNLVSEWLPDLPSEKLDVYKRTLPNHGNLRARPVDLFEREMPRVWQVTSGEGENRHDMVALFNWNSSKSATRPAASGPALEEPTTQATVRGETGPVTLKLDLKQLGLPASQYIGFDYWENRFIDKLSDGMELGLAAGSCKVISIVRKAGRPQVVSNSRHVAQENLDLTYVRWHNEGRTLSGRCKVVAGDACQVRIDTAGEKFDTADVSPGDRTAGVTAAGMQDRSELRVTLASPVTREVEWKIHFAEPANH